MASVAARAAADPLPPKVLGFVGPPPEQPIAVARMADLDELAAIVAREPIDLLMVFEPVVDEDALRRGVEACEARGVPVAFHVGRAGLRGVPRTAAVLDQPFVIHEIAPKSPDALAIKHAFDFVAALVGVVALLPVWIVVSLAIVVTMGRPVLFVQERAGLNGRRFSVLKFRTMIHDAEAAKSRLRHLNEAGGPMFKMTGDPRVTRLGRFLRKTSLDELPQLFNVLTGSMSLVGPRPLPIDEQRAITGWHQRRLSMRPGITGLWQVNGRSDVPFEQCMRYDLEYVDGWSLVRDARILLKTIPAVLSRKGAR
jgi:exopolysaccharide biosynthesis polyprenyl glycosylphosphotransferase